MWQFKFENRGLNITIFSKHNLRIPFFFFFSDGTSGSFIEFWRWIRTFRQNCASGYNKLCVDFAASDEIIMPSPFVVLHKAWDERGMEWNLFLLIYFYLCRADIFFRKLPQMTPMSGRNVFNLIMSLKMAVVRLQRIRGCPGRFARAYTRS